MKFQFMVMFLFSIINFIGAQENKKPNILFIAIDDLRPELNCYGENHMVTPNIDKIAERDILFNNAYCQQAVCSPSRNSLLTGLRPDAIGIYDLYTFFRTKIPNVVTIPQQFKLHGYKTESVGKIFHTSHGNRNDTLSWNKTHNLRKFLKKIKKINSGDTTDLQSDFPKIIGKKLPFHSSEAPEEDMTDAIISKIGVQRLKILSKADKPFFLAVGFMKPHLPFVAPKKYWNLYDASKIKIPERKSPIGIPVFSMTNFGELRKYHGIPKEIESKYLSENLSRKLIHGYRASVSMIDNQVGKLFNTLKDLNIIDNTIIILWGDHGFKLGDYGLWCKHSNCELDTRAPLIISAPGFKKGIKTNSITEFVDIYPTLCELAGIDVPNEVEGKSLVPILKNPLEEVKKFAVSQYPKGKELGYDHKREIMGYTITDGKYRYIKWQSYEDENKVYAEELYNHKDDRLSHRNLANEKQFEKILIYLRENLKVELSGHKKYSSL